MAHDAVVSVGIVGAVLFDATKATKKIQFVEEKFNAGENNWKFHLRHENEEDVGIFLDFYGPDCTSAEFTVFLKSSEGEFVNIFNTGLKKYAPVTSNIEEAAPGWGRDLKSLSVLQKGFLMDDILNLKLKVSVYATNPPLLKMLSTDFKRGLNSALGSDVTFIFLEEEGSQNVIAEIKAHRAVLSFRSSVFATMFGIGMTEATSGEVKISDMTPKAFRVILKYIYSGGVDSDWRSVPEELLYGADKYELNGLKDYLCENILSALTARNVWKIRKLASLIKLPNVLKSTVNFIKDHPEDVAEAVEEVTLKKDRKSL